MVKGKAIIISAPSGSGKTTIVKKLLAHFDQLSFSISATSRGKRFNEENGKDYYFLSGEEFMEKVNGNQFVEWEEVYSGIYYGTLKSEIERLWALNKTVVFDVDVKGGVNLKKYFAENALSIFIKVKDLEELEKRLKDRNSDSEESINQRINKAASELEFETHFDKVIINDVLETCYQEAVSIVEKFLNI